MYCQDCRRSCASPVLPARQQCLRHQPKRKPQTAARTLPQRSQSRSAARRFNAAPHPAFDALLLRLRLDILGNLLRMTIPGVTEGHFRCSSSCQARSRRAAFAPEQPNQRVVQIREAGACTSVTPFVGPHLCRAGLRGVQNHNLLGWRLGRCFLGRPLRPQASQNGGAASGSHRPRRRRWRRRGGSSRGGGCRCSVCGGGGGSCGGSSRACWSGISCACSSSGSLPPQPSQDGGTAGGRRSGRCRRRHARLRLAGVALCGKCEQSSEAARRLKGPFGWLRGQWQLLAAGGSGGGGPTAGPSAHRSPRLASWQLSTKVVRERRSSQPLQASKRPQSPTQKAAASLQARCDELPSVQQCCRWQCSGLGGDSTSCGSQCCAERQRR